MRDTDALRHVILATWITCWAEEIKIYIQYQQQLITKKMQQVFTNCMFLFLIFMVLFMYKVFFSINFFLAYKYVTVTTFLESPYQVYTKNAQNNPSCTQSVFLSLSQQPIHQPVHCALLAHWGQTHHVISIFADSCPHWHVPSYIYFRVCLEANIIFF